MKLSNLSYNHKTKLLSIGALLFLLICYQYAFKKTWNIFQEYRQNYTNADQSGNYQNLIPGLQYQEKKMADLINNHISDTLNTPKETLAFITSFCKQSRLKLTEYLPVQIAENSGFNIATRQISVEGSFKGLIKLLYELENQQFYGRLCSASFKSVEDPYSHNIILTCTFYLQNLIAK